MKAGWAIEIAGIGMSVPERIVTNEDFAQRLDTSDEWIVQRTGIRERRYVAPNESTLDLALAASRGALADAGVAPADIDLVIVAPATPEHALPATGNELQHALGCRTIPSFDLGAACSGFVYALITAAQFCMTGLAETVLWHLRVLAGWLPPAAVGRLRALAAWFELVNIEQRVDYLAGGELRRRQLRRPLSMALQTVSRTFTRACHLQLDSTTVHGA